MQFVTSLWQRLGGQQQQQQQSNKRVRAASRDSQAQLPSSTSWLREEGVQGGSTSHSDDTLTSQPWSQLAEAGEEEPSSKRSKQCDDPTLLHNPLYEMGSTAATSSSSASQLPLGLRPPALGLRQQQQQQQQQLDQLLLEEEDAFSEFSISSPLAQPLPPAPPLLSAEHRSMDALRVAFAAQLRSALLFPALIRLEQTGRHIGGPGEYASLEHTLAALFALCERGHYRPAELSPVLMLTMLWIVEGYFSTYRSSVDVCLQTYLRLNPSGGPAVFSLLRVQMGRLQIKVLQRCEWRMPLGPDDINAALAKLSGSEECMRVCDVVRQEALHLLALQWHQHQLQLLPPARALQAAPLAVWPVPRSAGMPQQAGQPRRPSRQLKSELNGAYWQL